MVSRIYELEAQMRACSLGWKVFSSAPLGLSPTAGERHREPFPLSLFLSTPHGPTGKACPLPLGSPHSPALEGRRQQAESAAGRVPGKQAAWGVG